MQKFESYIVTLYRNRESIVDVGEYENTMSMLSIHIGTPGRSPLKFLKSLKMNCPETFSNLKKFCKS